MEVLFFQSGSTAVFKDNEQQPKLQESWILLYAQFLKEKGIDPTKVNYKINMNGNIRNVTIFEMKDGGYNWKVES